MLPLDFAGLASDAFYEVGTAAELATDLRDGKTLREKAPRDIFLLFHQLVSL